MYIKPYYYRRPSNYQFVEPMNTNNRRELHRLMVFLKVLFNNNNNSNNNNMVYTLVTCTPCFNNYD